MIRSMLLLCAILLLPLSVYGGTAKGFLSPTGPGAYTLSGSDFDRVAGLDITVKYDTAFLSKPVVVIAQGGLLSGTFNQVNAQAPGVIRFAALSTTGIKGSGPIATITFTRLGNAGTGNVSISKFQPIDIAGANIAAEISSVGEQVASGDSGSSNNTGSNTGYIVNNTGNNTGSSTSNTSNMTSGSTYAVGGTITMPTGEPVVARDEKEKPYQADAGQPADVVIASESAPAPAEPREQVAVQTAPDPPAAPAKPVQPVPSVLERFRTFEGERTAKKLIALFDRSEFGTFSQDPPVAMADGQAVVRVSISKLSGDKTPNFAFTSARYVSLTNGAEGGYLITVKPDKKVVTASITMLVNDTTREFPLAVSPKARVDLIKSGEVTEADFQLFLKERGTADVPKHDLNGDGKRDYVDDYIFTANYLVQREKAMSKEKSGQKPPAGK